MKVYIDSDEWYPVYVLIKEENEKYYFPTADVPSELFERWDKVKKEFDAIQREIESIIEKGRDQ